MLVEFSERCAKGYKGLFDNSLASGSFVVLVEPLKLGYLCGRLANICRKRDTESEENYKLVKMIAVLCE